MGIWNLIAEQLSFANLSFNREHSWVFCSWSLPPSEDGYMLLQCLVSCAHLSVGPSWCHNDGLTQSFPDIVVLRCSDSWHTSQSTDPLLQCPVLSGSVVSAWRHQWSSPWLPDCLPQFAITAVAECSGQWPVVSVMAEPAARGDRQHRPSDTQWHPPQADNIRRAEELSWIKII